MVIVVYLVIYGLIRGVCVPVGSSLLPIGIGWYMIGSASMNVSVSVTASASASVVCVGGRVAVFHVNSVQLHTPR